MTQTTTPIEPSDLLMSLIVTLLTPMFLGVSASDVGMARRAAIETVGAYRVQSLVDLIAVAQIIGFGLAALASLSQSLAEDLPLPMALRLRANANALNRSAEQNRRALQQRPVEPPAVTAAPDPTPSFEEDEFLTDEQLFLDVAAAQVLAAEARARLREPEQKPSRAPAAAATAPEPAADPTAEKRHQQMWAVALVKEASDLSASIPTLPPEERQTATIRAGALSSTANVLLTGVMSSPPPLK